MYISRLSLSTIFIFDITSNVIIIISQHHNFIQPNRSKSFVYIEGYFPCNAYEVAASLLRIPNCYSKYHPIY